MVFPVPVSDEAIISLYIFVYEFLLFFLFISLFVSFINSFSFSFVNVNIIFWIGVNDIYFKVVKFDNNWFDKFDISLNFFGFWFIFISVFVFWDWEIKVILYFFEFNLSKFTILFLILF